jgi:hypothetical protein
MSIEAVLGRPRAALVIDAPSAERVLADRGTKVTTDEKAEGTFDTIVFGRSASRLGDLVKRLEDGGHVIAPSSERSALQSAGLELLSGGRSGFALARRRPERRKLSLTVGMISMNEENAVGGVIDDIKKHAPDAKVLLVDSSKDRTAEIAQERGADVIKQFPPKGYGPAMTRLLYEATTDVIVTMDCDGTYPADRIGELHRLVEDGADLVNATRTRHRPKAMPFPNFIANRVFAGSAYVFHGLPTTDVHSGMRAYRTSMLRGFHVEPKGAALPVEIFCVPARIGYRIVEVEIDYFVRIGETTLHRFDSTKWTFKRLLRSGAVGSRVRRDHAEIR